MANPAVLSLRRYFFAGLESEVRFAHGLAFEFEPIVVMHQTVEDYVGHGGVSPRFTLRVYGGNATDSVTGSLSAAHFPRSSLGNSLPVWDWYSR